MNYPKIKSVYVISDYKLEIIFENLQKKIYDCAPILKDENFKPLLNKSLFKNVHVDNFGYGIYWNEKLDLSESELWLKGKSIS